MRSVHICAMCCVVQISHYYPFSIPVIYVLSIFITNHNLVYDIHIFHSVCRPFSIGVILMVLHEFCGCFTMTSYAGIIFSRSGSSLSPSISAIIIGTIQFLGAYVSTVLVDRLGRKVGRGRLRI